MMDGSYERPFEQDPSAKLDYSADFRKHCALVREPDKDYALNAYVRPARSSGFQYKATAAGHSGTDEPRWPTVIGGTVVDGSVTWTAEAVSTSSLKRTLSTAVWTADSGLTASGDTIDGALATVFLSGGTAGQLYLVRCDATFSDGSKESASLWIRVTRPRTVSA